ncbi:MAG: hypothetical protein HWE30_04900 [Methylocystaceae bacterium]|nr:hypothetical protein [Methylocystaceae bacterium]
MSYIETAFAHLAFAGKLYHLACEGRFKRDEIDIPLTFQDQSQDTVWVLPDKIFDTDDDLLLAFANSLSVAFGTAGIVLDSECGRRPNDIETEADQCRHLIYQIRNAFAHNMADPHWEIRNPKFQRVFEFGGLQIDLSDVNGKRFEYRDIGGLDVLECIKDFAIKNHLTKI